MKTAITEADYVNDVVNSMENTNRISWKIIHWSVYVE